MKWVAAVSLLAFVACDKGSNDETPEQKDTPTDPSQGKPKKKESKPKDSTEEDEGASTGEGEPSDEDTEPGSTGGKDESDGDDTSGEEKTDTTDEDGKIDCSSLKPTGSFIGQVPANLEMINAKGEKISLHDHCNDVLYLAAASAY